jgi:hypothetical protein
MSGPDPRGQLAHMTAEDVGLGEAPPPFKYLGTAGDSFIEVYGVQMRVQSSKEIVGVLERLQAWHHRPAAPTPPVSAQGTDLRELIERLRIFVRSVQRGGCRMLSVGDACHCALCDVDRIAALAAPPKPVFKIHATDGTPCFSDQASGPSCGNDAHYRPPTYDDWMGHSPAVNGPHHCAKCGVEIALAAPPLHAEKAQEGDLSRGGLPAHGAPSALHDLRMRRFALLGEVAAIESAIEKRGGIVDGRGL